MKPDAVTMSDRAIARELGVSQPFVSALRRRAGQQQQFGPVDRHSAGDLPVDEEDEDPFT